MTKPMSKYKSSIDCPYTCITSNEKALTHKDILNLLNEQDERIKELEEENKRLREDLTDQFTCISILEVNKGLAMEDILYNVTGAESKEEFEKLYDEFYKQAKVVWQK